ncbi:YigZ family protein [candidate division KSB1 bacterium]|nr:YigZ family protein [candidate division KSB1 bacterium]
MSEGTSTYLTIAEPGHAETRVLGSRFFGRATAVEDVEQIDAELRLEARRFHDATHWCHASRIGYLAEPEERCSDAGEPHGTAGQPILREIRSRELTNTLVLVTRYFGGTKLGSGGLARAYSDCAAAALAAAIVRVLKRYDQLDVACGYNDMSIVYRLARKYNASPVLQEGTSNPRFELTVEPGVTGPLMQALVDESAARITVARGGSIVC